MMRVPLTLTLSPNGEREGAITSLFPERERRFPLTLTLSPDGEREFITFGQGVGVTSGVVEMGGISVSAGGG